MRSLKTT